MGAERLVTELPEQRAARVGRMFFTEAFDGESAPSFFGPRFGRQTVTPPKHGEGAPFGDGLGEEFTLRGAEEGFVEGRFGAHLGEIGRPIGPEHP